MAIIISGPGVGLPYPQNLYPSELNNAPADAPTNYISLAGGDVLVIPATGTGGWMVDPGAVSVIQWLDPVTGTWRTSTRPGAGPQIVTSDGFTRRVANLTGCPVTAVVQSGGSGFAQSTATITANTGGSTWQAVVGGSLSVSTISNAGKNYTMPPQVFIAAPPSPGVQATAYTAITGGSVTTVSLTNFGAGYTSSTVAAVIVPNPADPNAGGSITQASVTIILNAANATAITGALCTNNGTALPSVSALTLTAAGGAGTGATITPVIMQAVTSASVVAAGAGMGLPASPPQITSTFGLPVSVSAIVNPAVELTAFKSRPAQVAATITGTSITAVSVVDPGLFVGVPTALIIPSGQVPTTAATVTLATGAVNDVVTLQPL